MKLLVTALLLVAACQAEVSRTKQKEDRRAERTAEGSAVEKRAPAILPTVTPSASPGIEYADKDSQTEKTPTQVYVRPVTQVAKISDVLTGQGPPFPAAIASHLYSPLQVYQPRLSSPTTYEISAPIPSQLAYSEHKVSYQPQQNAIQYTPQEYNQKLPNPKQAIARLTVNYQPYPQQLLVHPQPILYNQQPQPVYQQYPVYQPQAFNQQPVYNQPQVFQAQTYQQQPLIQLVQAQPGITYADQDAGAEEQIHQRPSQRELKTGQPEAVKALDERSKPQTIQNYNPQPQGAVSYASFSQGPPAASYIQPQYQQQQQQQYLQQQQQQQPQQQQQQSQQQQYRPQPPQQPQQLQYQPQQQQQQQEQNQPQQQYQIQIQPQPIQYQPQQYQVSQYQPAQKQIISNPQTQNLIAIPIKPNQRQIYLRQGPVQAVPYQAQVYQGQDAPGYQAAAPHFPPVQYFGKFAHTIFGQYQ